MCDNMSTWGSWYTIVCISKNAPTNKTLGRDTGTACPRKTVKRVFVVSVEGAGSENVFSHPFQANRGNPYFPPKKTTDIFSIGCDIWCICVLVGLFGNHTFLCCWLLRWAAHDASAATLRCRRPVIGPQAHPPLRRPRGGGARVTQKVGWRVQESSRWVQVRQGKVR